MFVTFAARAAGQVFPREPPIISGNDHTLDWSRALAGRISAMGRKRTSVFTPRDSAAVPRPGASSALSGAPAITTGIGAACPAFAERIGPGAAVTVGALGNTGAQASTTCASDVSVVTVCALVRVIDRCGSRGRTPTLPWSLRQACGRKGYQHRTPGHDGQERSPANPKAAFHKSSLSWSQVNA